MNDFTHLPDKLLHTRLRHAQGPGGVVNRSWPAVVNLDRVLHAIIIRREATARFLKAAAAAVPQKAFYQTSRGVESTCFWDPLILRVAF